MKLAAILAGNIRREREAAGMSRAEMAKRTGLTSNFIEAIENGRRVPSVAVIGKIAAALDVKGWALFVDWQEE
jgi:transcriptional regulator with XRE-family HTH domain